jgi:hypothetical protein
MKVILLILIGLSSLVDAGGLSRSNGVVSDNTTNLKWQDDYSDNSNNIKHTTWQSAIDYCENLTLNGQNDWRLPNKNELLSIVDYTKSKPSINEIFVKKTVAGYYWSSTTTTNHSDHGTAWWVVYFGYGYTDTGVKNGSHDVRCVRSRQ